MGVSQNTQKWILAFFMFFNGVVTPGENTGTEAAQGSAAQWAADADV
jgi:hypothetical protein